MQAELNSVLEAIEKLDADELRQVEKAVRERLYEKEPAAAREAFHQALVQAGLVREIRSGPPIPDRERPLVPIEGKPLSETVIEERR